MGYLPKILFVDDYVDLVISYQLVFKNDFEIIHAGDLEKAFYLLHTQPIDIIVADYYLPDGFGIELIEEAVERDIPIILTTGDGTKIPKYGQFFSASFPKPVNLFVLGNTIHDLLDLGAA
jgi:DNA-binding NtrC family response regulator